MSLVIPSRGSVVSDSGSEAIRIKWVVLYHDNPKFTFVILAMLSLIKEHNWHRAYGHIAYRNSKQNKSNFFESAKILALSFRAYPHENFKFFYLVSRRANTFDIQHENDLYFRCIRTPAIAV